MDPYNFTLQSYESIPFISQDQYQNRKESSKRIVLFKNLIVDLEGFDHPGYNNILTSFIDKDIYEAYTNKMHSLNADLILCHRTIGKLEDSPFDLDGKTFYNSVKNNEKVKKHQQVLEKYDHKAPILQWIKKLNSEQLQIITEIPKIFKQPEPITFSKNKITNYLVDEEHFWISFTVFVVEFLAIASWIFSHYSVLQVISSLHLVGIGIYGWTLTEYCSHRFQLHPTDPLPPGQLRAHLLHHSFPNLKTKVALSWFGTTVQLILLIFGFRFLFSDFTVSMLFLGFVGTLICYDCIHYYCHFGPQTQFSWLKTLRINHLKHHYRSQQLNFGVTTNLWDKVFGTYDKTSKCL